MAQRVTQGVGVNGYRRDDVEVDPPYLHPDYVATRTRSPKRPLILLPHTLSEITGPVYGHERIGELDHDLTRQHDGEPLGERIIVHGRVLDGDGRPVRNTLVEIWQANAAGRYAHGVDNEVEEVACAYRLPEEAVRAAPAYYRSIEGTRSRLTPNSPQLRQANSLCRKIQRP